MGRVFHDTVRLARVLCAECGVRSAECGVLKGEARRTNGEGRRTNLVHVAEGLSAARNWRRFSCIRGRSTIAKTKRARPVPVMRGPWSRV